MSSSHSKKPHLHNALSLLTLFFLLSIITITLTQTINRQVYHSRGQTKTNTPADVSPSYWIGDTATITNAPITQEPTIPQPTQTLITPTIYCLGGNPCTSPEPTATATPAPMITDEPTEAVPTITESAEEEPAVTETPVPTQDPCVIQNNDQTASTQSHPGKKHKKSYHDRGNHYGWFSKFFKYLFDFLEKLLRDMGVPTTPPTSPTPSTEPSPTQAPEDPCISVTPTQDIPTATPEPTDEEQPASPTPTQPQATSTPSQQQPEPTISITVGTSLQVKITFYGSYDNDPKGSTVISDPVIHQTAGGIGTYEDPLTFASPDGAGAYEVGAKIYVPLVQKYFIKEDTCAVSWTAPNGCGAVSMVDLYVGNPSTDEAVVECENSLTPSGDAQIILNPPANLPYDPTPIWNQNTKTCMTPHN